MNLQTWQDATKARLQTLAKTVRTLTPGMVYGALSATTIIPVITAVSQGNFAVLATLGSVVGGIGGNLIAEQVSRWNQQNEDELAASLPAELAEHAAKDSEWRAALDTLLDRMDALRVVQAILSEADKDWFTATLRDELTQLGNLVHFEALLDGSGAIAQGDHAQAAGERGAVVGGDAGQVTTGDNNTIITADTVIVAQEFTRSLTPQPNTPANLEAITETYLRYLVARYAYLDFKGMGMADRVALRLPLAAMYVPLKARVEMPHGETWAHELRVAGRQVSEDEAMSMGQRVSEPTALIQLLQQHDGLIILGDPGAGKTTFLKYLTLRLAQGHGDELGLTNRLPILVPLSAYANAQAVEDVALQDFLGTYYRARGIDLPVGDLLTLALEQGQALLLLDGLDEVQALSQRSLVAQRVQDFFTFHRARGSKFILTSRIVGYRDVRAATQGLAECTLIDFDQDDIADFVGKWTLAIERAAQGENAIVAQVATQEETDLLYAVEHNPGVRQLAANPLLLTILALMKRQGVTLPERRAELYDKYVETLLRHWNLARGLDGRTQRLVDHKETLKVLAPLALWMHETSPGVGLVKREDVRRQLEAIYQQRAEPNPAAAAEQLLIDARDHASLLLERGPGEYGFIHLTFQEYLAAVALAQLGQQDVAPVVTQLAAHVDDIAWHEVTLLCIGYMGLVQQRDEAAGDTLMQLIAAPPGEPGAAIVLAGEAVVDTWPGGVSQGCQQQVVQTLHTAMVDEQIAPPLRAKAGSLLGALGDERDLDEMVPVPGGDFLMGSDDDDDEKPPHNVHVDDFRISKYPVTNGQYARFVEATDHAPPNHWRGDQLLPDLRNHPVVNVSWHDAQAYCQWLGQDRGETVRLPTEAEWEKAARGTDGRVYPWGDEFDPNHCNMGDTGIDTTSPVGIFSDGASPYGVLDMAGNVDEWVADWYDEAYYANSPDRNPQGPADGEARVLRGGAFIDYVLNVRCANRARFVPGFELHHVGFRCVSPGF